MSEESDRYSEFYAWLNDFYSWSQQYDSRRLRALKTNNKEELNKSSPDYIAKVVHLGLVLNDSEMPGDMKQFVVYCQTFHDIYTTKQMREFADDLVKKMKLGIKPKDPDYWKKLTSSINAFERSEFPKTRSRATQGLHSIIDRVTGKVGDLVDKAVESNEGLYIHKYLPMIIADAMGFYVGDDDVVTASNFLTRHESATNILVDSNMPFVLVSQGGHYLICTRDGRVIWDKANITSKEASDELTKTFDLGSGRINTEWLNGRIEAAGVKHVWEKLNILVQDLPNLPQVDLKVTTEEEAPKYSVSECNDYYIVTNDVETIFICDTKDEALSLLQYAEYDPLEYLFNILGGIKESDIDAMLEDNQELLDTLRDIDPPPDWQNNAKTLMAVSSLLL